MAFKKKLHRLNPKRQPKVVVTKRTRRKTSKESCEPADIERNVRQLLADKVTGNMAGIWLLVPEFLRLGVWDLLGAWAGDREEGIAPRLAMHQINEAALCTMVRKRHNLSQKGFELANGLPFVPTDLEIHQVLSERTMQDAQALQIALGKIRRASGHYRGKLLAIDPHHMRSYTKRQTRRHKHNATEKALKTLQSFFCIDAETHAPVCCSLGSSSYTVTQATPKLMDMAGQILGVQNSSTNAKTPLVLADGEHFTEAIMSDIRMNTGFDLMVPVPDTKSFLKTMMTIPQEQFTCHWPGFATTQIPYRMKKSDKDAPPLYLMIQREGERMEDYQFIGFLCTANRPELPSLTEDYPDRWHVEEFFNTSQDLGWKRAGTLNLNIRYNAMSLALVAEAALYQLRHKLGEPYANWSAASFADKLLEGLDGDIRVQDDIITVTYYDVPKAERWQEFFERSPEKLEHEGVDPAIPWLYGFKLDFRFK